MFFFVFVEAKLLHLTSKIAYWEKDTSDFKVDFKDFNYSLILTDDSSLVEFGKSKIEKKTRFEYLEDREFSIIRKNDLNENSVAIICPEDFSEFIENTIPSGRFFSKI